MNLSLFIAKRYFFSKRKKNFINVITIISMLVVSIGTAALIIVLSVFNGMEELLRSVYATLDAPLQVLPAQGKSFVVSEGLLSKIKVTEGVTDLMEVIEDNALVKYDDAQMVVKVKGVSPNFVEQERIKKAIRQGELKLQDDHRSYAVIGRGIQYYLGVSTHNDFLALQFFYPKNKISAGIHPSKYYLKQNIMPGGVFAIEQHYDDNYVFVPLVFAEKLFQYRHKRTSIEVFIQSEEDLQAVQTALIQKLGKGYRVLNSDQQHADLYKVLKIEKLMVFIIFSLIVGIASINLFFALSMLVIEKKKDIHSLLALGASRNLIRKIFLTEGAIIAAIGVLSGLGLGFTIVWVQQTYRLVPMGVAAAIVQAYPVDIQMFDFVFTAVVIAFITFLAAIHPAIRASRIPGQNLR